jgi:hypothetical protein
MAASAARRSAPGEADQQQRAVAQSGQVGFDRRQDLAQDIGSPHDLYETAR